MLKKIHNNRIIELSDHMNVRIRAARLSVVNGVMNPALFLGSIPKSNSNE